MSYPSLIDEKPAAEANFFWMTYKPEKWPLEEVQRLVADLAEHGHAHEPCRIKAHRRAKAGDIALAFKQGKEPRGIFGVGVIVGACFQQQVLDANSPKRHWFAPVRWDLLVDPSQGYLLPYEQIKDIVPDRLIRSQASGAPLDRDIGQQVLEGITGPLKRTDPFDPTSIEDGRQKIMASIFRRQGQGAFRADVLAAYERRCAITGCAVEAVLEAAHIVPYRGPATNHVSNGLLLRADLPTLFDLGLVVVDTKDMTLVIAPALVGTGYALLAGKKLTLPVSGEVQPCMAALNLHRRDVFKGSTVESA